VLLPLVIAAGFAAGGLWASVPALLKTRLKVDDVVSSLLLNYVMIHLMGTLLFGPLSSPARAGRDRGDRRGGALPDPAAALALSPRVPLALLAVAVVWFVNARTVFGYRAKAVGAGPRAAFFGGIPTESVLLRTAVVSGGLAGLAGVGELCAIHYHLLMDISPGYGYTGIVIAMLGALHPVGCCCVAVLQRRHRGSQTMSRMTGVPVYIVRGDPGAVAHGDAPVALLSEYRVQLGRRQAGLSADRPGRGGRRARRRGHDRGDLERAVHRGPPRRGDAHGHADHLRDLGEILTERSGVSEPRHRGYHADGRP